MCCTEYSFWFKEVFEKAIIPFLVGALSFILFRGLDEKKKRRTYSTLGVIIIDSLIEEVNTGLNSIRQTINIKVPFTPHNLPIKSWIGINTLSDDVLLRIISVSKNVRPVGIFHPKDIRKHTKNYFDHMCASWNNAVQAKFTQQNFASSFEVFPEAAKGVKDMLEQTKQLLENNSKKWFPK